MQTGLDYSQFKKSGVGKDCHPPIFSDGAIFPRAGGPVFRALEAPPIPHIFCATL
jgi:hypothetical protein